MNNAARKDDRLAPDNLARVNAAGEEDRKAGANVAAEENNVADPFDGFREEI